MIGAIQGAFIEAWQEIRIHKARVILSLVGVMLAIASLTLVVAMNSITERLLQDDFSSAGGRAATLRIDSTSLQGGTGIGRVDKLREQLTPVLEAHEIKYASLSVEGAGGRLKSENKPAIDTTVTLVDPSYKTFYPVRVSAGSWFAKGDEHNLAPAFLINSYAAEQLGVTAKDLPTAVQLQAPNGDPYTITVRGIFKENYEIGRVIGLAGSAANEPFLEGAQITAGVWVPPEQADEIAKSLKKTLQTQTGEKGWNVNRSDFFAGNDDPLAVFKVTLLSVATLILFLGAMGLINIAIVTVQQRIREIGIRRSFGATASRVFFSVLMESVVATTLAGLVGIGISVWIVQQPWFIAGLTSGYTTEVPPFPGSAAITGLLVSVITGAIAGFIPAVIATRVRIIEAIRV
ncbi:ABC transporter permease [Leucobacter sp. OH1287]|uniref:ABC transporter permease n=1 Tax=Leucobacter sp. OH1287 TaxID=2491049 RepID=UPI000F5EA4A6|nr:ABC transporter permease [Leucobacter sp. OH1287]RRD61602.1 ABC transporter permease [Leucobacter sp. OH1287]